MIPRRLPLFALALLLHSWLVPRLCAQLVDPAPRVGGGGSPHAERGDNSLPRYDLAIRLDTSKRQVHVNALITWTNRSKNPVREIVFNTHARYTVPDDQVGFLAKMLEILRMSPSEAFDFNGPPLDVQQIALASGERKPPDDIAPAGAKNQGAHAPRSPLAFAHPTDNPTSMIVALPEELKPGESVTMKMSFSLRIPPKKGRWGQWDGVTTLAQWLPVMAVHDDAGWHPVPFIPWHQPFFNEAGHYSVRIAAPADQKIASSGMIQESRDLGDGWVEHTVAPLCVRDFAIIASSRFSELIGDSDGVKIRVLTLPEHEWYGKETVKFVMEALPVYNQWFGKYPYPQFTVVESFFGWNGNECGSLVMIDYRMFGMPHLARAYIDYLVSHELCHQWWYNVVGTNGFAETWMDEGLATYFSHRLMNAKVGKDNTLLQFPRGLEWLPNITRDDFRNYGYLGARARGQIHPTVQDMPKFNNLVNLSATTYDRGSKIVGMIEERMGEQAFLGFMRHIYKTYQFRILRVADFQRELETYTGRSWDDFFQNWVYGSAASDWSVERVNVQYDRPTSPNRIAPRHRVTVTLRQQGEFNEPTVLGIRLNGDDGYQIRIPIIPEAAIHELPEERAKVESFVDGKTATVRVSLELHEVPTQISVDPDRVLLDSTPTNNHWKPEVRWRFAPIYTQLEEADVTNRYDRWNVIFGPWIYGAAYADPWYTRSPMAGLKASVLRTQHFLAGAYVGYRSNDRNLIAGADVIWDHFPLPNTQLGFTYEKSLDTLGGDDVPCSRGVLFGRYVILPTSSLYLPPFEYVEVFGTVQNRCLPNPRVSPPGSDPFDDRTALGIHYHKNYVTPYWDAEAGVALDVSYQYGLPIFGNDDTFHQVYGQIATVKKTPQLDFLGDGPILNWLRESRWGFRLGGAAALPDRGQFFTLGGGEMFRGFDLSERQGSLMWVGSVEWRIPVFTDVCWDALDHLVGIRNVYVAPFYDVGDAYVNGHSLGPVAHAFGAGLRVDVAWLGLIERTILRFDVAKTIHGDSPVQFWFGVQHPF
ncbi:MAG: hypothetical protein L0Y70_20050 [Gemmataceae bacterium]|nr:hypothetical protein [Gemmataceae bacterium]